MGTYGSVVVAGTFDRLHPGHTTLLERAIRAVRTDGKLVVGVTTGKLVASKEFSEMIEPFDVRCDGVRNFLHSFARDEGVFLELVPIDEAVPTRGSTDPALECIVVSEETAVGAEALNEARRRNGVSPLKIVTVGLVDDGATRLSSTSVRRKELGSFRRKPWVAPGDRLQPRQLSPRPYIIGLTGGIASGKSTVRRFLCDKFGAAAIDCDSLAHKTYLPGTPTYSKVVKAFGTSVLAPDGTIHRPSLGAAVFGNPALMSSLTSVVWPAVRQLVSEEQEALAESASVEVAVVEAAMMVEARTHRQVDELWVVGSPRQLARDRLMCRNGIGEEEAERKMDSQMDGSERMKHADVALYNGGSLADLEGQVALAWALLQERLASSVVRWRSQREGRHPMWSRWVCLMDRLAVDEDVGQIWWGKIQGESSASWRRCSGLDRVQELYRVYHEYAHFLEEPAVLHLAFFFHLFGNTPKQGEALNPLQSSSSSPLQFLSFAEETNLDQELVDKVKQCLNSSCDAEAFGDTLWFADFLKVVCGEDKGKFGEFCALWKEQLALEGVLSESGEMREVAVRILGLTTVFSAPVLQAAYELKARENLSRLLQ